MNSSASRREFILATASVATAGVAGCSGGPSGGTVSEPDESSPTPTEADTPTDATTYRNGVGDDASTSFAVPSNGAELTSPYVQWKATAEGVTIEEAGEVTEGAGHYHVMIDTDPVTPGEIIPGDESHVHYGTGQQDGVLELEPGEHTLHLQIGDGEHRAMDLTDTVEVTVTDEASLSLDTTVDGSVVDWEITAENYTIEPASEGINSNAGHLHAIIDADPVPVGAVIPSDANHIHFGDGSTGGRIDLADQLGDEYEPGEHAIHFQVGTGTHRATMVLTRTSVMTT